MAQSRSYGYAQAGMPGGMTDKFNIRAEVRIKDATAGRETKPYEFDGVTEESRRENPYSQLTLRSALIVWAALLMVLVGVTIAHNLRIGGLVRDIDTLHANIDTATNEIYQLDLQILEARDVVRISYQAVQTLGMIPAEEAEMYYVTAPDTRPFEHKTVISARAGQ